MRVESRRGRLVSRLHFPANVSVLGKVRRQEFGNGLMADLPAVHLLVKDGFVEGSVEASVTAIFNQLPMGRASGSENEPYLISLCAI